MGGVENAQGQRAAPSFQTMVPQVLVPSQADGWWLSTPQHTFLRAAFFIIINYYYYFWTSKLYNRKNDQYECLHRSGL